jgi:spore germination protein
MKKTTDFDKKSKKLGKDNLPLLKEVEPSEALNQVLSPHLSENLNVLKYMFKECSDLVIREFKISHQVNGLLVFIDGIVETEQIHEHAIRPLLFELITQSTGIGNLSHSIEESGVSLSQISHVDQWSKVVSKIVNASAVIFLDGYTEALALDVRCGSRRSVQEPETEAVIRGPREGFTENIGTNLSLVRFKIKSPKLKTVSYTFGEQTQTRVILMYLDGIIEPKVVEEVRNRLEKIKVDSVLESAYIEEFIEDNPYSPFPQLQYTERPDTVAAHVLEGGFAIFVDGSPFTLLAPITLWRKLQSSEDYYERYIYITLLRWLRYGLAFLALFLPSMYIAIVTFHQDMLPTSLLFSITTARESIPFPAVIETFMMEISFEALREAGVRLPKYVGQAVSILGALVIGQAAVQAGIVSAPIVIIVSMTGIASFTIPRYSLAISFRILRFPLMIMAGLFGLFGIVLCALWIAIHLCQLQSFGVPYLSGIAPLHKSDLKDIVVRVPWWKMIFRPTSLLSRNRRRIKPTT